jgi:hypothetical protein
LHTATRSSLASIISTNKANTVAEVRVWIVPQGQDATPANWSYIAYDADITATNSLETFRFPVMSGDKIYVRSTTADVSFQIMGIFETGADTYVYAQPTQPTAPQVGDIWVDTASDVPSIDNTTVYRWSKTAVGGETSLSGAGNDLSILKYIAGYEQVYLNGVLLAKTLDYTATNGTSITSLTALSAGDIVEVISPYAIELTDVYTKSVSDSKYSTKVSSGLNLVVPASVTGGTVAANGEVTFTSTSSIILDGVFTSAYQNYKLVWNLASSSANFYANLQYRKSGVTNATAGSYLFSIFYMDCAGGSGAFTNSTGATQASITYGTKSGFPSNGSFEINNPMISRYTTLFGVSQTSYGTTASQQLASLTTASTHMVNDTFDGFIISPSVGATFTGTIRIYGYNNGGA